MTFRWRVLALITVAAVTASGATAWLTLRQAAQQVTATAAADQRVVTEIVTGLTRYGRDHAGWDGIATAVADLSDRTGQRIRIASDATVLADSDALAGRPVRDTVSAPVLVDPRPALSASALDMARPEKAVQVQVLAYRYEVTLVGCLWRAGSPAGVTTVGADATVYRVDAADPSYPGCVTEAETAKARMAAQPGLAAVCGEIQTATEQDRRCLEQAYAATVAGFGPTTVRVYIGAPDTPAPRIAAAPVILATAVVTVVILLGAYLLSRRVLRPIEALTTAAAQLGGGDLHQRVPASGSDELAALGQSFNRMAEALQRSEERQRHLVADVAHELRTPLANLRGYLEALKDGVVTGSPALFASLHEEAILQQRIVDDLQDLAQAEAGQLAYHREPVDTAALIEAARAAHLAAAEAAQVTLRAQGQGDNRSPLVLVDPHRMRQVLGNLLTNAIRATPPGRSVTLDVARIGPTIVLRVLDTGHGIAPEDLPHVFDRFWRADSARTRTTGGSGLGLAIARQIVTDHGGSLTIHSVLNVGTTLTITLPAE
jgi:two-component system sensor histidine kinase BaeS